MDDDDNYKCYESETQDGILTEIGNAATGFKESAYDQGRRLSNNFSDLRTSMRTGYDERAQQARQSFTDARENMQQNIDELSTQAR